MSGNVSLIVTAPSPLFIFVLADALEMLLRPGLPVSIPDTVYVEAARAAIRQGWSIKHRGPDQDVDQWLISLNS